MPGFIDMINDPAAEGLMRVIAEVGRATKAAVDGQRERAGLDADVRDCLREMDRLRAEALASLRKHRAGE